MAVSPVRDIFLQKSHPLSVLSAFCRHSPVVRGTSLTLSTYVCVCVSLSSSLLFLCVAICVIACVWAYFLCICVGFFFSPRTPLHGCVSQCPQPSVRRAPSPCTLTAWPPERNTTIRQECVKSLQNGGQSASQATLRQLFVVLPER